MTASPWPTTKARRVLATLYRIGWSLKRTAGSHRVLAREGWPDVVFAFHDGEEIGPRMLARLERSTGLRPEDLWRPRLAGTFSSCRGGEPGASSAGLPRSGSFALRIGSRRRGARNP